MFPYNNTNWILCAYTLESKLHRDIPHNAGKVECLVKDSGPLIITANLTDKKSTKCIKSVEIPTDTFFSAVDTDHIPEENDNEEIRLHILELKEDYPELSKFFNIFNFFPNIIEIRPFVLTLVT